MSPQLCDALRHAADQAGCSMNSYAVQVLAAASGDPACFRASVDAPDPARPNQQWRLRAARNDFIRIMSMMSMEIGAGKALVLVNEYDTANPGYYLEWQQQRDAERRGESPVS